MAIVSISRGSGSHGAAVAERAAARLGYRCLAREAVLEAAGLYGIAEDELAWAIDHSPSFFERTVDSKERYLGAVRAALLHQFAQDDVVYHGFAGHYFARDIDHALKVRILAELEDRVAVAVARDRISAREARRRLRRADRDRQRWGLYLYGMDPEDPSLYDIVLHVGKMGVDGAAEIISTLVQNEVFQTTERSRRRLQDQALVASVRAALADLALDVTVVDVSATDGSICVGYRELPATGSSASGLDPVQYAKALQRRVHKRTHALPGFRKVRVERRRRAPSRAASTQ